MSDVDISVIVPLGPFPRTEEFLIELLDSIAGQTYQPKEIVIIDDAAHLDPVFIDLQIAGVNPMRYIKNPWNLGESASRNIAIAHAAHPWVFQAAYDDTLEPDCLAECAAAVERQGGDEMGYYYVVLRVGGDNLQGEVGGHALFHKRFWAYLGGYPKCGALGLSDIGLIDLAMVHGGHIYKVANDPLYNHRDHEHNTLKSVTGRMRLISVEAVNETSVTWKHPDWVEGFNLV